MSKDSMNNHPDKRGPGDGEDLAAIYGATPRDEPPPALDARILAAAEQAASRRGFAPWQSPLAMAAVLVLGVAVGVLVVQDEPPPTEQDMVAAKPQPLPAAPATEQQQGLFAAAPPMRNKEMLNKATSEPAPARLAEGSVDAESGMRHFAEKDRSVASPPPPAMKAEQPAPAAEEKKLRRAREEITQQSAPLKRQLAPAPESRATLSADSSSSAGIAADSAAGKQQDTAATGAAPEVRISIPMDSLADMDETVTPTTAQQKKLDEIQRLLKSGRTSRARRRIRSFMDTWPTYPRQDLERRFGKELVSKAVGD